MIKIENKGKTFFSTEKAALELYKRAHYGILKENKIIYMPYEVIWLIERKKALVFRNDRKVTINEIIKKMNERELLENFVYRDLRKKGYIVKPGTKFGGNFLVYDRGKKPGKDHADWILIILKNKKIDIDDLSSKARIATTTKKKVLIAIVRENKNVYYELKWKRM